MSAVTASSELICDHRSPAGPTVTHIRGTVLASSLAMLKERGHFARYTELLPPAQHDVVLFALASSWVPIDAAVAHYRACDALGLGGEEMDAIGEELSNRYAGSIFGTLLRTSRQAGLEGPWIGLRAQGRIWDRVFVGGAVRSYRTGLKDAYLEQRGLPLAQVPYFRQAYVCWFRAMASLVVRKLHLRIVPPREPHPLTLAIAGSWV